LTVFDSSRWRKWRELTAADIPDLGEHRLVISVGVEGSGDDGLRLHQELLRVLHDRRGGQRDGRGQLGRNDVRHVGRVVWVKGEVLAMRGMCSTLSALKKCW
jgi:hypothetical protein